jgi:drug/metabolite transporter (DMT)-like permease
MQVDFSAAPLARISHQVAEGERVSSHRSTLASSLAILWSALLWGTLWIPLRRIHEAGASGAAAITIGFLLPLVLLLPFALTRWRRILTGGWALGIAGFLLAVSIALYSEGLLRGTVARVLLSFYLTPVWSTLFERLLLGEPIAGRRVVTIILGLAGMAVIFGGEAGVPLPRASAEWMGLTAGITWGLSMVFVKRTGSRPIFDRVFAHFVFLGPAFLLATSIPGGGSAFLFEIRALVDSASWLMAFAVLWMLPVIWLTIFGASHLGPGRVAIFLMLEIVVGLTTASLLTDEPFGMRELIGAVLITGACGVELGVARPISAGAQ